MIKIGSVRLDVDDVCYYNEVTKSDGSMITISFKNGTYVNVFPTSVTELGMYLKILDMHFLRKDTDVET